MSRLKLILLIVTILPISNATFYRTTTASPTTKTTSGTGITGTTSSGGSGTGTTGSGGSGTGTTSSGGSGTGTTTSGGSGGTTGPGTGTTSCPRSKYRTIDSSCSSTSNPTWGKSGQPFGRMLPPNYSDGISSPPVMANGSEYVSARSISFGVFSLDEIPDPSKTLLNIFFLQAIGNDLSMAAGSNDVLSCCLDGQVVPDAPSRCYPVLVPSNDAMYSWFSIRCLNYARALTSTPSQPGQAVKQVNDATSLLDLSFLYGTSLAQSNSLRTFTGGRLLAARRNGVEWPVIDPAGCIWADICYLVADRRSYQFPMSATVHLLFLREHNRVANQLKLLNPLWTDEVIFQEARRINVAQYQYIVYYEYLPRVLGRTNMLTDRLIFEGTAPSTDFNAFQDPASVSEFGNVLLPFMQSQIPGSINFYVNDTIESMRLSSLAGNLGSLENVFASFFAGLTTQETRLVDTSFSIEWKNFMYRGDSSVGEDLLALDIQRMRDFGFARYNDYRSRCGLSRFATWEAYNITQRNPCFKTMERLQMFYSSVDDLDLFVGASFEEPLPGSVIGPTFYCLFKQQFLAARTGDRYFFEAGGQDGSFTAAQLAEIRKVKLARLMCSAFPTAGKIQADVLGPISETNPLVACSSLPSANLAAWRE